MIATVNYMNCLLNSMLGWIGVCRKMFGTLSTNSNYDFKSKTGLTPDFVQSAFLSASYDVYWEILALSGLSAS